MGVGGHTTVGSRGLKCVCVGGGGHTTVGSRGLKWGGRGTPQSVAGG